MNQRDSHGFMHGTQWPNAPIKPLMRTRYIDDILAICTGTYEEIKEFETWTNGWHPHIKFTLNSDPVGILFLDTFLSIEHNKIRIWPLTKPTDTKHYIQSTRCHPPHIIKSIPYSQALHIKRICTHKEDLVREMNNLFGYFMEKNYPLELLSDRFTRALTSNQTNKKHTAPTTMVIAYNPCNPNYVSIIHQIWKHHMKHLPGNLQRSIVHYKRHRNLREQLVHAAFSEEDRNNINHSKVITLKNQLIITYNREQMLKHTDVITIWCKKDHKHTTKEFSNLEQAISIIRKGKYHFVNQHQNCGKITEIPITGQSHITVKCTECSYIYRLDSELKTRHLDIELKWITHLLQKSLHRPILKTSGHYMRLNCLWCINQIRQTIMNSIPKSHRAYD